MVLNFSRGQEPAVHSVGRSEKSRGACVAYSEEPLAGVQRRKSKLFMKPRLTKDSKASHIQQVWLLHHWQWIQFAAAANNCSGVQLGMFKHSKHVTSKCFVFCGIALKHNYWIIIILIILHIFSQNTCTHSLTHPHTRRPEVQTTRATHLWIWATECETVNNCFNTQPAQCVVCDIPSKA